MSSADVGLPHFSPCLRLMRVPSVHALLPEEVFGDHRHHRRHCRCSGHGRQPRQRRMRGLASHQWLGSNRCRSWPPAACMGTGWSSCNSALRGNAEGVQVGSLRQGSVVSSCSSTGKELYSHPQRSLLSLMSIMLACDSRQAPQPLQLAGLPLISPPAYPTPQRPHVLAPKQLP